MPWFVFLIFASKTPDRKKKERKKSEKFGTLNARHVHDDWSIFIARNIVISDSSWSSLCDQKNAERVEGQQTQHHQQILQH